MRSVTRMHLNDESKWQSSHDSIHATGRKSDRRTGPSDIWSRKLVLGGRNGNEVKVDARNIVVSNLQSMVARFLWRRTHRAESTKLEGTQQNASAGVREGVGRLAKISRSGSVRGWNQSCLLATVMQVNIMMQFLSPGDQHGQSGSAASWGPRRRRSFRQSSCRLKTFPFHRPF